MSYPKKLNKTILDELEPITSKLSSLLPGEDYIISSSPETIKRVRTNLYRYFKLNNLKQFYKIKELSMRKISILRLETSEILIEKGKEDFLLPKTREFFETQLIHLDSEDEVEGVIQDNQANKIISSKEAIQLIELWKQVNE